MSWLDFCNLSCSDSVVSWDSPHNTVYCSASHHTTLFTVQLVHIILSQAVVQYCQHNGVEKKPDEIAVQGIGVVQVNVTWIATDIRGKIAREFLEEKRPAGLERV